MEKAFQYYGKWYLPEAPHDQIPGYLDFSSEKGIDLRLSGIFQHALAWNRDLIDLPIIWGVTEDGKTITLNRCHLYQRGNNSVSWETCAYQPMYMFIGHHLSADKLKFRSIDFEVEDFDEWQGIFGFQKNEFTKADKRTVVDYVQPTNFSFPLIDDATCEFKFTTYAPNITRLSAITIRQVGEVSLSKSDPTEFAELFKLFHTFHMFLTLAYFERPPLKSMKVIAERQNEEQCVIDQEIEVHFRSRFVTDSYKPKQSHHRFLFTYKDIRQHFGSIILKWYKAENNLGPAVYGLTEAFSTASTAVEVSFLNVAHAIETFHRRTYSNQIFPSAEYKARVKEIVSDVKPEYQEWLKMKLEYSNEPTLDNRLRQLVNSISTFISEPLLKPTPDKFIQHFKWSRNYYTHYSQSLQKKALKGSELYFLRERSKILLICLMLQEIGIQEKDLINLILRKSMYLFNHLIDYKEAQAAITKAKLI